MHTRSHTCVPQASSQPWAAASPPQRSQLLPSLDTAQHHVPLGKCTEGGFTGASHQHPSLPRRAGAISHSQRLSWDQHRKHSIISHLKKTKTGRPGNKSVSSTCMPSGLYPSPPNTWTGQSPSCLYFHLFVLPWTPRAMEGGHNSAQTPPENPATLCWHPSPTQPPPSPHPALLHRVAKGLGATARMMETRVT